MNEKSFFFNIKLASTQMCMKKQVGDTGSGEPLVLMIFVLILSNYITLRQTNILL
jgi:hypothetical protein